MRAALWGVDFVRAIACMRGAAATFVNGSPQRDPQVVASAKAKWGAKDPAGGHPLRVIAAFDFAGSPVPARSWHVAELTPTRTVTMPGGDGGTSKSLPALQLAVATAVGTNCIGLPVQFNRRSET